MRLLFPGALWWLLLTTIIVFFYLLKLRRKRAVVPSVLLWSKALEELEANVPLKKLRRSLLMLLQLIVLAALVFALARPLVTTRALASGSTVIIIDSTASMTAIDEGGRSRLDRAKDLAREMIGGLSGNDKAAIIESSSRVTVRCPLSSDHAELAAAVADVHGTDAPGDLADALRLAEQTARTERDAAVVVISDGGSVMQDTQPAGWDSVLRAAQSTNDVPVRFVRVGRRSENVGIVAMNSRDSSAGGKRELFASIANFSDSKRSIGCELKLENNLIDARTIELEPNERRALVFDSIPGAGGLAELKLDVDDDLAADNFAYCYLPSSRPIRVGVVSNNPFLIEALAANDSVAATKVSSGGSAGQFDCMIIDQAPLADSEVPALLINPPDSVDLWKSRGEHATPEVLAVARSHPVDSSLNLTDVHLESFTMRDTVSWLRPLVTANGQPTIWAGDDGHRRIVLIGFDLAHSDLPLKVEFPILLANTVSWLAHKESPAAERSVRAGQAVTISSEGSSLTITTPDSETKDVVATNGTAVFGETLRAGVYKVKNGAPFGVSLLSEGESNTLPRDSIKTRNGESNGQPEGYKSEREIWRWIALFVLVVLMLEWWVYHRRVTA
jgi:Ca-activated chloride channel homolog